MAADRIIEAGQLDAYCTGRGAANTVASAVPRKYPAQSRAPKRKFICLYHQRFGPDARNCKPGCMFANVLTTQHLKQTLDRESRSPMTSAAGDLAMTNTLSVWDRNTGTKFLIDTGADVCVFSASAVDRRNLNVLPDISPPRTALKLTLGAGVH